jgi:glycosyltransferase involved in cell wall biosynthesis
MTVSVIIPAYNVDNSLQRCVDSVLAQTYVDFDIVVVDDGSTDKTRDIARGLGEKITLIEQNNQGQAVARNVGVQSSTGKFVAFLDADDYWEPQFLEKTVAFLESRTELDAVLTAWTKIIDHDHSVLVPPLMHQNTERLEPFAIKSFYEFWVQQNHIQTGAILLRRDLIERGGLMLPELRVSQDMEYWGYLAHFGQWGFLPESLFIANSRVASRGRWISKYRKRRRLCPTVQQWESRIRDTVAPEDLPNYRIVRGRIAAGFVHMMVNGHRDDDALATVKEFGASMPESLLTGWLRYAASKGGIVWKLLCNTIRLKEHLTALSFRLLSAIGK